MSDLRFNTGAQSMDAAPDPSKLESRVDLHRTATQPEKEGLAVGSGTSLDVEACVRLLREAADLFAERARSAEPWEAAASNLKSATMNVLALALPGMGKAMDALETLTLPVEQLNHATWWLHGGEAGDLADDAIVKITDAKGRPLCSLNAKWLRALIALPQPERQPPTWEPDTDAARAAQPEETSADATGNPA